VEWTVAVVTTSDVFLFSCRGGHLEIVKALIGDHKVNCECADNKGKTPLHHACRYVPPYCWMVKKGTFICATKNWNFHYPEIA